MRQFFWIFGLWMLGALAAVAADAERGIIVTGEGRITVAPDMAQITLGVTHQAPDAKEAMTMTANDVAGILSGLQERGIRSDDLQTSRFYLRPVWQNSGSTPNAPPKIVGYEAGNSVTVKVRDLRFLGDVLDAAVDLGGNDFNGLTFGVQDDRAARSAARKAAVADAIAKANELADAAGMKLGRVSRMTEESFGGTPMMAEMAQSRSMGDAIAPGEIEVTVQVTMVFNIRPNI